ncbi:hypothetical protein HO173_007429 [Letharia columbiana]|uniref:DNA mismatch repair proteins mutS family domain-containing protein n=1 Tax=Letharia columbiana TaxID=112416 RepID=A0A8H6L3Q3_9LECA|nr:uncharacterized protein HO173_007429 [Letharia columbiana]KAF6234396.1 hypothetical protein HO173_007429 [Letharia columbiana]
MIAAKRRRDGSITATPTVSQSNDARASSFVQSSPLRHYQRTKHPQQRPTKRVGLHLPGNNPGSSAPSFYVRPGYRHSSLSSVAASAVDVARENEIEGEQEEDSDPDEVIMCVDMRERGTVGCCYYESSTGSLHLVEDIQCGGLEMIGTLKLHIQPTVVILSMRVDETVERYFDPDGRSRGSANGDSDQFSLPYVLEIRPSQEFSYDAGKNKLINLRLFADGSPEISFITPADNDPYDDYGEGIGAGYTGRQGQLLRLSASIDIESRLTIGCAGALLTYVTRRKAVKYLPNDVNPGNSFRISTIEMFSLKGIMFVNADTLASLQILQSESNPNTHSQGPTNASSGSKEGLSVYGLFHHFARTPQGKYLLRQYFLRPSLDLNVINQRLETASVFLRPDNNGPMNGIVKSLGQIKNMRTVMIHLRKGISNGLSRGGGIKSGIWSSLRSFAFHTLQIRDALAEVNGMESLKIGTKILQKLDPHGLARIGRNVSGIVDFVASADMHRTVVKSGVSAELDNMKRTYDGIEDLLNLTSQEIAATIPAIFSLDLNVIFFPQIGFLISIPLNPDTGRGDWEGGEIQDQHWDRIFSTATRVYYKDFRMRELDETLGDMYAVICDKEIEIIHELGERVLEQEAMLNQASDICGELDSLLALAQGARSYKFSRPRITRNNVIQIKGGRHALQELTVPAYVPNDTFLVGGPGPPDPTEFQEVQAGNDEATREVFQKTIDSDALEGPSMLIMTGPNYSGKSVYLKQVALIVYMAHVGCFVPADRAIVGLTDKILTRIATRETVSRSQSAFMIDLQQVALAMTLTTHRSLVIIDEFGKGTDSSDGAGLACGVFEHFLGLGIDRPKVLGATHFHEIIENGFLQPRPSLTYGYMEVRLDREAKDLEDQVTYLYNFRAGRSNTSYGSCCATLNGVDATIVDRANYLLDISAKGEDLVIACAKISEKEENELKDAEEIARLFLIQDFRSLFTSVNGSQEARNILAKLI